MGKVELSTSSADRAKESGEVADNGLEITGRISMVVNGIANLATSVAETRADQAVSIAVLKKALDSAAISATTLIEAIPPVPPVNLPAHLGQNINTTA